MITDTLKVISANTNVILVIEKVITYTLKIISAVTNVVVATEEVITATFKNYLSHYKSDPDH